MWFQLVAAALRAALTGAGGVQGMVQGALGGTKALAQGLGPLLYAGIFSLFSRPGGPLPFFPGGPHTGFRGR